MSLKSKGFSKKLRLTKPCEFKKVKDAGKYVSSRMFILSFCANSSDQPRLGLVVSSIIKRAVDRNRIKRLVREHFRNNLNSYPKSDIIFVAKQRAEKATNEEIFKDIETLLEKTK